MAHVTSREPLGTQPNVEGLPRFTNTTLLHLMLLIYIRTGGKGGFSSGRKSADALYIAGIYVVRYGNIALVSGNHGAAFIEKTVLQQIVGNVLPLSVIAKTS